jgi:Fe-S cluster assembly protein SufD
MSALQRMLEEFEGQRAGAGSAGLSTPPRLAAAQALRTHALPTRRDENWRYADLQSLDNVRSFLPAPRAAGAAVQLPEALPGFARLVFVDGRLHPEFSLPDAALLATLRDDAGLDAAAGAMPFIDAGDGRLGLIAGMFAPEPLALRICGTLALELISIVSVAPDPTRAGPAYTEISLRLAPHTKLELVERVLSAKAKADAGAAALAAPSAGGPAMLSCARLRVQLEADAQLVHTRLQQSADCTLHYDTLDAALAERASYQLRVVAAGAGSARSSTQVRLLGREAMVQIRALASARGAQVADSSFTVLHQAPGTRSDQLFRGIASDRARVACSADVQVAASAPGARVQQSLRGLIDGKGAEVDLRPRLTIDTDDIQATHGATTGRLDDDLLFYLLSRGLTPAAARSLLKWAFLGEAFSAIEPAALRRAAELAAAARLSDAPAAELLQ